MIRALLTRLRTVAISSVAIASILTFDRAALGRTSCDDDLASAPVSSEQHGNPHVLLEAAHVSRAVESRPGYATWVRAGAAMTLRREPICHISRHPRDGVRASLHACPSLVAVGRAVGNGEIARSSTTTASSEDYSGG